MEMYLEADSILKSYNDRLILTDVYIKVKIGDIMAVWGRNGSGKSTLFKIIFGSENAEHLFLRINDRVIRSKAYHTGLIAYLPQFDHIPTNLSVSVLLKRIGIPIPDDTVIKDVLERIKDSKVGDLSGGELRMLEVLLVLNNEAPFVILDEPFVGMSPVLCERLCDYIKVRSKNKGVIISDHNYPLITSIANKHYLLEEGYLRPVSSAEELKNHYLPSVFFD